MRQRRLFVSALATVLTAVPMAGISETIYQTVNNGFGDTWNSDLWGATPTAPTTGNDYVTTAGLMEESDSRLGASFSSRVRSDSVADTIFAGDSITLVAGTELLLKQSGNEFAEGNIILDGGIIRLSSGNHCLATVAGTINVVSESYIGVSDFEMPELTVSSALSGDAVLHLAAGIDPGVIRFSGDLSGFSGTLALGGGEMATTLDFDRDYDLSAVDVVVDARNTEIVYLDQNLKFNSFSFDGISLLADKVYTASELSEFFGEGIKFYDFGGTISVYTTISSTTPQLISAHPAEGSRLFEPDDFPLTLGGVIGDADLSFIDPDSVSLMLDGVALALSAGDVVKVEGTTTVSRVISSLETGDHSLSLVYSATGAETGPFTNEWSFSAIGSDTTYVLLSGTSSGNDQSLIDFLENNFNVYVSYADYSDFSAHSNEIAKADVLMVGRALSSAAYANYENTTAFNALTVPVVSFTSYVTRPDEGRWGWHDGGVISTNSVEGAETIVTDAGAAVFEVAGGSANDWYAAPPTEFHTAGSGYVGGGEVLASIGGNIIAAHWNAGDQAGVLGSFGGERLLFNLSQDGSATIMPSGEGLEALIKALVAYTPLEISEGGIDPSVPVIQTISVESEAVSLSWDSVAGTDYGIQRSSNLDSESWQTVLTVPGNGSSISTNVATGDSGTEFFRLIIE